MSLLHDNKKKTKGTSETTRTLDSAVKEFGAKLIQNGKSTFGPGTALDLKLMGKLWEKLVKDEGEGSKAPNHEEDKSRITINGFKSFFLKEFKLDSTKGSLLADHIQETHTDGIITREHFFDLAKTLFIPIWNGSYTNNSNTPRGLGLGFSNTVNVGPVTQQQQQSVPQQQQQQQTQPSPVQQQPTLLQSSSHNNRLDITTTSLSAAAVDENQQLRDTVKQLISVLEAGGNNISAVASAQAQAPTAPAPAAPIVDEAMITELKNLRDQVESMKTELAAEQAKVEELMGEKRENDIRVEKLNWELQEAKQEKDRFELQSTELNRCLERLQEDLVWNKKNYDKRIEEESNKITQYKEMRAKCQRLKEFLPENIVTRSYLP